MIQKALEFATMKHKRQTRKGTTTPYINHCYQVMTILSMEFSDEELIVAGILHDTLEDTNTSYNELVLNFGQTVADLVLYCSEDKKLSWKERKSQTIEHIKNQINQRGDFILLADKIANLKDSYDELLKNGFIDWGKFNQGYEEQRWYYRGILDAANYLHTTKLYLDFKTIVEQVFEL